MVKRKINAFALIELLAVIVILAVIIAIAAPQIGKIIDSSTKKSFEMDVSNVFKTIKNSSIYDLQFNPSVITQDNIKSELGLNDSNYKSVRVDVTDNLTTLTVVGKNKWDGLTGKTTGNTTIVEDTQGEPLTPNNCFNFDEASGTLLKYDYVNCSSNVVIPSTINGAVVEHIGPAAFNNPIGQKCRDYNNNLTVVDLSYIHTEGDGYYICGYLYDEDVTFPITSVILPKHLKTIGQDAFAKNQLTSISVPDGVTIIGVTAFYYNNLSSVDLPNSLTKIDVGAFASKSLETITIPNSVTRIGSEAFCYNLLTNVDIPNNLTTLEYGVFAINLLNNVTVPSSVEVIEDFAFIGNRLISVTIENGLRTIGESALSNNLLTSLELPNSVTTLGKSAFANNKLTSVALPSSLTKITHSAFF